MTFDSKSSTFTRSGSFRVGTATDTLSTKSLSPPPSAGPTTGNKPATNTNTTTNAANTTTNPHAIERPHAPPKMLERQVRESETNRRHYFLGILVSLTYSK